MRTGWRRKSISEETTFETDVNDDARLEQVLLEIAETLTRNLRREGARGRTVTLKIRLQGFETFTRSKTVAAPTDETKLIRATAQQMFREFDRGVKPVRLIGIGVSNLIFADDPDPAQTKTRPVQLDLFADGDALNENETQARSGKDRKRDELLDGLKDKFGNHIKRGSLL